MLYIEKENTPAGMQRKVAELKSDPNWRLIAEGEPGATDAIRFRFDQLDKDEIRQALLREQHGLCAYCMKRIRFIPRSSPGIDHWIPLHKDKEAALSYANFHAVCFGGSELGAAHYVGCCDKVKDSDEDAPNLHISPLNRKMMQNIRYDKNGIISYAGAADDTKEMIHLINDEINRRLQLNGEFKNGKRTGNDTTTQLVKGRRDAYRQYEALIKQMGKKGIITKVQIQRKIDSLLAKESRDEFVGVIVFFLQKRKNSAS